MAVIFTFIYSLSSKKEKIGCKQKISISQNPHLAINVTKCPIKATAIPIIISIEVAIKLPSSISIPYTCTGLIPIRSHQPSNIL